MRYGTRHARGRQTIGVVALIAVTTGGCFIGFIDEFPSVGVRARNAMSEPAIIVLAQDHVQQWSEPRVDVAAYLLQPGEQGWAESLQLLEEPGLIRAYRSDCRLLAEMSVEQGTYDLTIDASGALDVVPHEGQRADEPRLVRHGDSCGFAAGFETLPPGPLPTDGPIPAGTIEEIQRSALATLRLEPAEGVVLQTPGTVRWLPEFTVMEAVSVRNDRAETIVTPNELTVLYWTGDEWLRQRCLYEQDPVPLVVVRLCRGAGVDEIPAHATLTGPSGSPFFDWPGAEAAPGTYALILPVRSSTLDDTTEGASAIVTVTANP